MDTKSLITFLKQIENDPEFKSDVISDYYKCLRNQILSTVNNAFDSENSYNKLLSDRCVDERILFNKYSKCNHNEPASINYKKCQGIIHLQKIANDIDQQAEITIDGDHYIELSRLSGDLNHDEL